MALVDKRNIQIGSVWVRSGHLYKFHYNYYEHDPSPTIICLNTIQGINPKTGHRHDYVQAINFTYIPRNIRKQFGKVWVDHMIKSNGKVFMRWSTVQTRYPYLMFAIRRYRIHGIRKILELDYDDIMGIIGRTMMKDFSYNEKRKYDAWREERGIDKIGATGIKSVGGTGIQELYPEVWSKVK
jgi:hypothetical protein